MKSKLTNKLNYPLGPNFEHQKRIQKTTSQPKCRIAIKNTLNHGKIFSKTILEMLEELFYFEKKSSIQFGKFLTFLEGEL